MNSTSSPVEKFYVSDGIAVEFEAAYENSPTEISNEKWLAKNRDKIAAEISKISGGEMNMIQHEFIDNPKKKTVSLRVILLADDTVNYGDCLIHVMDKPFRGYVIPDGVLYTVGKDMAKKLSDLDKKYGEHYVNPDDSFEVLDVIVDDNENAIKYILKTFVQTKGSKKVIQL